MSSVCAVVVTYGDRGVRCLHTVQSALSAGVNHVVIVDNASALSSASQLDRFVATSDDTSLVRMARNTGSAGGFTAGLRASASTGFELIVLLDDDCTIAAGSLAGAIDLLTGQGADAPAAVSINRIADPHHARVLAGEPVGSVYAHGGEFFEFDLRDRCKRKRGKPDRSGSDLTTPELPYAPYGGLLLRRSDLQAVGFPREDFVLYGDDYEFTARFPSAGGRVLLSANGGIDDMGERWSGSAGDSHITRMLRSPDRFRSYYLYRNLAILERERARRTQQQGWFAVNRVLYTLFLVSQSLRARSFSLFRIFLQAQGDASNGRMGQRFPLPGHAAHRR